MMHGRERRLDHVHILDRCSGEGCSARMELPIISAKLAVPQVPASYLSRPRLDRLWPQWRTHRLVLVTAGAGFGKTALLAANARREGECAWYSLDEQDRDLGQFCAHLSAGVAAAGNGASPTAACPARPGDPDFGAQALAHLLAQLHARRNPLTIVLDDAHLVGAARDVTGFLERLVRFLPESTTLILAAREPLPIRSMKLRAAGDAALLSSLELRFTEQELAELMARRFADCPLGRRVLRRVLEQTEGWAAGIEIFLQIVEGTGEEYVTQALDRLSSAGSGWFDYFAEEVVSRLDGRLREFLYRSSVLPRLEAGLCNRVLGRRSSQRILEQLHDRNLFTYSIGEGRKLFRYHHLFRRFLHDRVQRTVAPADLRALQRRAARALVKSGELADALSVFAEAGDHEGALQLMERSGERLLETGQNALVRQAFEKIPASRLRGRYDALFVLARLRDMEGEWEEAERLYRRVLRTTPAGLRRAELLWGLGRLKVRWGEYEACARLCRRGLEALGRRRHAIGGKLLTALAVADCERGRLAAGEGRLAEADALYRSLRDPIGQARVAYTLAANVHMPRGEFQKAKDAARRALAIFRRQHDHLEIARCLGVLGFVAVAGGDVQEGREIANEGLRMAESLEYPYIESYCRCALGRCAMIEGDLDSARGHYGHARELGEMTGESDLLLHPRIGLAEVALASGNRHAARRLVGEALGIAHAQGDRLQEGQCLVLLGLAQPSARRRGDPPVWARADRCFRESDAHYERNRLLLLRLDERDVPERQRPELLRELLSQAARMDHDFLFLKVEPERAGRIAAEAVSLGIESAYARQLLIRIGERAVGAVVALLGQREEETRARAVDLLTTIGGAEARAALTRAADSKTPVGRLALQASTELEQEPAESLRIAALGPLQVTVGGRRIEHASWRSRRALRLFQLLLIHRFGWVPRDGLLEALWPESEPRLAGNNLRQSLHVLRRTLEPELPKTAHSRYVRQHNEAYRLVPGEEHSYDMEEFLALLEEGEALWRAGERRGAEGLLTRAIDLYRGDFLEESPYEEFVTDAREELRERLVRTMRRLLEIYAAGKRWEECVPLCRRALIADPYQEEFHRYLVQAHLHLRNRVEALADYHTYEERMVRDLGVLPSERMRALADAATALGSRTRRRNPRSSPSAAAN
ncbi:MAG: tetratricopeptide repeat protein [Candidatus Eisenbacteria bacterium]|nr:tetratricopeptide repeat protein [Candidatus Eisenbacteria bacterium]